MPQLPVILAFESSCDDTGVSVIQGNKVLANTVANQAVHEKFGGVVPELASRAHVQNIVPALDSALQESGIDVEAIDAVAYTLGPGLMGSLHVGSAFAKSWAWSHSIPMIPVNHMQAHILAHFLAPGPYPTFPFLCLTVSGGHTQLVHVNSVLDMKVLGTTRDDAAGEAFDKVAKLMGLPYPGGPVLDRMAAEGDAAAFAFSKPNVAGLDMSFSGLKTQIWQFLQRATQEDSTFIARHQNDIAASVQKTILDVLIEKLEAAAVQTGIKRIAIAGGVSANSGLRARLAAKQESDQWEVFIPPLSYCTDNAAMVAMAGSLMLEAGSAGKLSDEPQPRWTL
ncbi:MAG TPA: tRNA (adenosine(37)-N6)-threonylcarbamoyltransferase complex transferase subunit TsaD [Flavobacteriales bacterium]|nr:tRNA (adenosine(37)-N6)-threonylcarbamoyltransferase complex transferase subunit TsaD [Flavobacteriales bacterium]